MTRWGFLLARSLRNEPALQRLSVPQAELLETLRGKSVALVGNARALAQGAQGPAIDAARACSPSASQTLEVPSRQAAPRSSRRPSRRTSPPTGSPRTRRCSAAPTAVNAR